MDPFMKISVWMCLAFLMVHTACSPPVAGPGQGSSRIEPDGVTPGLTRSATPTLYNLEKINAVVEPSVHQPISIPSSEELSVIGWAVDKDAQAEASGVEIVVDGKAYRCRSGLDRTDVADYFKVPGYKKAGFSFSAPADLFGRGKHQLALRIIFKDGKSYFESPPLALNVE
jgi:hypothetical protein